MWIFLTSVCVKEMCLYLWTLIDDTKIFRGVAFWLTEKMHRKENKFLNNLYIFNPAAITSEQIRYISPYKFNLRINLTTQPPSQSCAPKNLPANDPRLLCPILSTGSLLSDELLIWWAAVPLASRWGVWGVISGGGALPGRTGCAGGSIREPGPFFLSTGGEGVPMRWIASKENEEHMWWSV